MLEYILSVFKFAGRRFDLQLQRNQFGCIITALEAVLAVVILSVRPTVCPSVCHTRAL